MRYGARLRRRAAHCVDFSSDIKRAILRGCFVWTPRGNSEESEGSSTKRQKKEHLFLAPDPPAKGEEEVKKMMVVNRLGIWRFVASDSVTLTPQERQRHEMSIAPPLVIAPLPPRSPRCKGKKNIFCLFCLILFYTFY